jgi:hypothetical protein
MPESDRKTTHPEPPEADEVEEVDESSDESFPASDPPSWAMGKRAEPKPAPGHDRDVGKPPHRDDDRPSNAGSKAPGSSPRR